VTCSTCARPMAALFTSVYCPSGCGDRKRETRLQCAQCGGFKVEPFAVPFRPKCVHCVDCGRVWDS
jgi:hypothetical protein